VVGESLVQSSQSTLIHLGAVAIVYQTERETLSGREPESIQPLSFASLILAVSAAEQQSNSSFLHVTVSFLSTPVFPAKRNDDDDEKAAAMV
jgi:hypothetical protein